MVNEYSKIPCKYFEEGIGCQIWCMEGDMDCCAICCRRRECEKENKICPKAKKILKMEQFKDKIYSWEIVPDDEKEDV